jgi:hypothetical protein
MDLRHLSTPEDKLRRGDRLVERYRTLGLQFTWHPPTRGLLGTRPKPATAEVIDVSVSGALLLAPANAAVRRGAVVDIEHAGARGRVEVRHLHSSLDPDQTYVGVQFVQLQRQLRVRIFELVAQQRGDTNNLEWIWRNAH